MSSPQKIRDSLNIYVPPPLRNRSNGGTDDPYKNCSVALNLHSCMEDNYEKITIRKASDYLDSNVAGPCINGRWDEEQQMNQFKGNHNMPPSLRKTQKPIKIDEYDVFQIDSYNIVPVTERNEQTILPMNAPQLCLKSANIERYSPTSGAKIIEQNEKVIPKSAVCYRKSDEKDTLADMSALTADLSKEDKKSPLKSLSKKNKSLLNKEAASNKEDFLSQCPQKVGVLKLASKKKTKTKTKVLGKGDVASQCTIIRSEESTATESTGLIAEPLTICQPSNPNRRDSNMHRSRSDKQSVEVDVDNWENLDTECDFDVLTNEFQGSCSIPPESLNPQVEVFPIALQDCNYESMSSNAPSQTIINSAKKGKRSEPPIEYAQFEHILELYDFPSDLRTGDLFVEFQSFIKSGFDIKWVDDTHCLAVFSDKQEADRAMMENSGLLVKARSVAEATSPSKWKILKSPGDWQMPYKARPQTSNLTAKRLISHHLGLKNHITPTQRRSEEMKLKDAKAKNRSTKQDAEDAWNGFCQP